MAQFRIVTLSPIQKKKKKLQTKFLQVSGKVLLFVLYIFMIKPLDLCRVKNGYQFFELFKTFFFLFKRKNYFADMLT